MVRGEGEGCAALPRTIMNAFVSWCSALASVCHLRPPPERPSRRTASTSGRSVSTGRVCVVGGGREGEGGTDA